MVAQCVNYSTPDLYMSSFSGCSGCNGQAIKGSLLLRELYMLNLILCELKSRPLQLLKTCI